MSAARHWQAPAALGVLGTGSAAPGPPVETADLLALMQARFGFARAATARAIADRMGITGRHLSRDFHLAHEAARPGASNADLAAAAVRAALDDAGVAIDDVAYLIGHTTTPDQPLPSNISHVADRLGYHGPHVELRQACTGFANALMIASGLIASGCAPVVIVGSETGSLFFDPHDLDRDPGQVVNMIQMGDGAGAVVLGPANATPVAAAWYGAIGVGRQPGISRVHGTNRFDHDFGAIAATGHALFEAGHDAATGRGFAPGSADHVVPHQVSGVIGAQVARHFALRPERMFVNADRFGNTGSAAIWIAFDALRRRMAAGTSAVVLGAEASKFMFGGFAYRHG